MEYRVKSARMKEFLQYEDIDLEKIADHSASFRALVKQGWPDRPEVRSWLLWRKERTTQPSAQEGGRSNIDGYYRRLKLLLTRR